MKKEKIIEIIRACVLYPTAFFVAVCLPGFIEMLPIWVVCLLILLGAGIALAIIINKIKHNEK